MWTSTRFNPPQKTTTTTAIYNLRLEEKAVSLQSVSKIFGNIRRIDYLCPCNSNYKLETKSLKLETRNY
jgi:hypothetical protein